MYLWDLLDIWGWKFSLLVRCSFPRSSPRLHRYRYVQKVSYHDLIQHDCEWLMFGVLPISFNYVDTYMWLSLLQKSIFRLVTYHSLPRCSGSLSLSLCESGAKYYLEETSCTCFPKWMSPSNNTNLCLVMFGSSASSMNSGIPGIPLFVKDTTVIILNASSLDLLSGDFPAFSGDQTFTYGNLVGGCILHCDLKRCWTRKHTHCIDLT